MTLETNAARKTPIKRVVHVTREYGALAGAGGIKDVTEGLCKASAATGIDTRVFLPLYRCILKLELDLQDECEFTLPMDYTRTERTEDVEIKSLRIKDNLTIHFVRSARYEYLLDEAPKVERNGIYTYTSDEAVALGDPKRKGHGYYDYFAMNVLLCKATLKAMEIMDIRPDIIHCHDGHAALLPMLARASQEPYAPFLKFTPVLTTIHNAGLGHHQEIADLDFAAAICAVDKKNVIKRCLLQGLFDPLLAGAIFGTRVNTVSENYARELVATGEDAATGWLGHTLVGLGILLDGITNGIDTDQYNPERAQPELAATFSVVRGELRGKRTCKQAALERFAARDISPDISLHGAVNPDAEPPLFTFISRLVPQKGMDSLASTLRRFFSTEHTAQVIGLGSGDPDIERRLVDLAASPEAHGRFCMAIGYSPSLAKTVYAAGDFFLMPSEYEPCGVSDYIAQLMGNIPIVHRIGGLVKTLDGRFGLSYQGGTDELLQAMNRALAIYHEPGKRKLREIQIQAARNIHHHFTWEKVFIHRYLPLYVEMLEKESPALPY